MPISKKASTPKLKRQWKHVEQEELDRGASPGAAAKMANGVVKKAGKHKRK